MSKYQKLTDHLLRLEISEWRTSFADIERILGFSLPPSAYQHPAWWANQAGRQAQSAAWQKAGWNTENLDLAGQQVTFSRAQNAFAKRPLSMDEGTNAFAHRFPQKVSPSFNAFAPSIRENKQSPMEESIENGSFQPLTIAQAKAGLAAHFGVPTDNIEIVIKG